MSEKRSLVIPTTIPEVSTLAEMTDITLPMDFYVTSNRNSNAVTVLNEAQYINGATHSDDDVEDDHGSVHSHESYNPRRKRILYTCVHIVIAVTLAAVGIFTVVFAVIHKAKIESAEGSLYFIGPVLVTGGVMVVCRIPAVKKRIVREEERQSYTVEELSPWLNQVESPPAYESVISEESQNGHVTRDRHHSTCSRQSSVCSRQSSVCSRQSSICSHSSRESPLPESSQQTSSRPRRLHSPPPPLRKQLSTEDDDEDDDKMLGDNESGSHCCSSGSDDIDVKPPTYAESITLSVQSFSERLKNVEETESGGTLPPSYTALSLSSPNILSEVEDEAVQLKPMLRKRAYTEPTRPCKTVRFNL